MSPQLGGLIANIAIFVVAALFVALLFIVLWRILKTLRALLMTCLAALQQAVAKTNLALFMLLRGKLTVRASTYLMALSQEGATTVSANKIASSIDSYAAVQFRNGAMYHVNEVFNGSKLALISEARLKGFNG